MGESALWSQAQGEGHKKQEKVISWSFINFSQKLQPQLNTFGFKRVHFDIIWQKIISFLTQSFSLDVEPMNESARIYEFV